MAPHRGPIWVSFIFYIIPYLHFLDLKFFNEIGLFSPSIFYPVVGANEMLPYGVPFESLPFLYLPYKHFFDLKFFNEIGPFFLPAIFILTEGDKQIQVR